LDASRSIEGFHLYKGFEECRDTLISFGGHKYAAGLKIDPSKVESFKVSFEEAVRSSVAEDEFIPSLKIDKEILFSEIDEPLLEELEMFAPHGPSNPEPILMTEGVMVEQLRILKDQHLKMRLGQGGKSFDAIAFNMVEKDINEGDMVSVAYSPSFNVWNGRKSIQLKVKDIKGASGQ